MTESAIFFPHGVSEMILRNLADLPFVFLKIIGSPEILGDPGRSWEAVAVATAH